MTFRRLYWVTEEVSASGGSGVTGVYTSIPDLIKNGIESRNGQPSQLRISLVKLDSAKGPLNVWEAPYADIETALQEYVKTEEFSAEQCRSLASALEKVGSKG